MRLETDRNRLGLGFLATLLSACAITGVAAWHQFDLRRHSLVAVIPETTAQELWESLHAGVAGAARSTQWHVYWNGPSSEDEIAEQIALVQHAEAIHTSGLILAPDHPLALMTVVRHVLGHGTPTVIVASGMPLEPRANLGFVMNNDAAAGEIGARYLGASLSGRGTVALFGSNPAIQSTAARASAFAHTLQLEYPGIRLITQGHGSFRMGEAEQETEDALRNNPDITALVTIGITQTRGSMLALHNLRRQRGLPLLAFDQDLDLMNSLRHGDLMAVVAQNTFEMGRRAMQMIALSQRGQVMPSSTCVLPVLITRENIDSPEAQQVLSMDWRTH